MLHWSRGGGFDGIFEQDVGIVQFNTKEAESKKIESQYLKIINNIFPQILKNSFLTKLNFENYKDSFINFVVFKSVTPAPKYNRTELNLVSPYGYFLNKKNKDNFTLQQAKDNCKQSTSGSIYNFPCIWFNTEQETVNCYNSIIKPYISKFICINTIIDRHTYLYLQNLMPKYDKEYTDKDYCKLYGINGYISEGIGEQGSDYQFIVNFVKDTEKDLKQKLSKKQVKTSLNFC